MLASTPVMAQYPVPYLDGLVGREEGARASGCFDDHGQLFDWAAKASPSMVNEPITWTNHAVCVLVDHSVHWTWPGDAYDEGDTIVKPVNPADAPYVSLDTSDYVCPVLLPSDQARTSEILKWILWAQDLGYKTTVQLDTFRDSFLKAHKCDLIAQRIERDRIAAAATAAMPPTKVVDPAHAKPGDIIKVDPYCAPGLEGSPCQPYETWIVKTACPARWVSYQGQWIWFTGNIYKDGSRGQTQSDSTPVWVYLNKAGKEVAGPFDALDDVCPQ
jgi:hypothetical protein